MQVLHLMGLQKQCKRETKKRSKFNFSKVFVYITIILLIDLEQYITLTQIFSYIRVTLFTVYYRTCFLYPNNFDVQKQ